MSHTQTLFACGLCHFTKLSSPWARFMSHAQRTWLDHIPLPLPHSTPSVLHPLNGRIPCNPQHGVQCGRLAEPSTITIFEPNDPVEVGSTEVPPVLLPSRRASFGSAYNSGEDVTTTPVSSEVDERPYWGMLASPCSHRRERQVQPHPG